MFLMVHASFCYTFSIIRFSCCCFHVFFFCFIKISPFKRKGPRGPVLSCSGCFVLPVLDCVQKTEEDSLAPATARQTSEMQERNGQLNRQENKLS